MKEKFLEIKFHAETRSVIDQANRIIREYQSAGFRLTLRQLYYQFVSRALIANKLSEYKRLGGIIDNGRQAGLIDWDAIEDRTRNLERPQTWGSPEEVLQAIAEHYQEDLWQSQEFYPEVWIEKDALTGVIEPVCTEFRVPYFACRGYVSQSEMYAAAQRLSGVAKRGREPVILHLGDHDPSGMHMTTDNGQRLELFMRGYQIGVFRLALNREQIDEHEPPPNPAKETDSRFASYQAEHGSESWELDALDPTVIDGLIRSRLEGMIDAAEWHHAERREDENRRRITEASDDWESVDRYLRNRHVTFPRKLGIAAKGIHTVEHILAKLDGEAND